MSQGQQRALMLTGVGMVLGVMSRTLIAIFASREREEAVRSEEEGQSLALLDTWANFEAVSREVLKKSGEHPTLVTPPPRILLVRLSELGKIDEQDVAVLERALQTRNSIAHGRPAPLALATEVTEALRVITEKIAAG